MSQHERIQDDHDGGPEISPADARLVDRLLGREGVDDDGLTLDELLAGLGSGLNDEERRRAGAIRALLGRLDDYPLGNATDADALDDEALVDATMARVDRVDRDLASLPLTEMRERHRSFRFRVPDLVGLAAAILLAVGILMPVTHRLQMASVDARCQQNMRMVGAALNSYANDFDGWLPMRAGLMSWDRTPSSENMAVLRELGYCEHGHLNCPGHPEADGPLPRHGGYAFRALDHRNRARIAIAPPSALMADRSNVVDFARSGGEVTNLAVPSSNHGHRGQYVLLGTLEVRWTASPVIPGVHGGLDNIYLIKVGPGTEDLAPGQTTTDPNDHFTH